MAHAAEQDRLAAVTGSSEALDPELLAAVREAHLRYVDDREPGIRRRKAGKGFTYARADGSAIRETRELERIRALAVPPAYRDVWICAQANGHLQATGRDARGRKQYRYHRRWRELRDQSKFEHTIAFARALNSIRERVTRDLSRAGLDRERVTASVVRLLDVTLARIGNESYAKENDSFGIATLRARHVKTSGSVLRLRFRGKSGIEHVIRVADRRLARIVRRCQDLPGQELFTYLDEDDVATPLRSEDVNEYLREASGGDFTAKDFRTWHATVLCYAELASGPAPEAENDRKKTIVAAVAAVAGRLRNTPAVCRGSYIHPAVLETYLAEGSLATRPSRSRRTPAELDATERTVLHFLEAKERARTT